MCSIIGYKGKFKEELVSKLLDESRIRGIHAFGFYSHEYDLKTTSYTKFKDVLLNTRPDMFVAHMRYSTSGTADVIENNQPLVRYDGQMTALVFNGVISQLDKKNMEFKYQADIPSDNDGWILMKYLHDEEFLHDKSITLATTYIQDDNLYAYRNKLRPMYYNIQEDNTVVIASTNDILERAGLNNNVPVIEHKRYVW